MASPVIISAHNLSSTSLSISWLPVNLPLFNGIPTGYMVHYRVKTSDNTTVFLNTTIDDYLAMSINISDLMKYTEYEMYMTATTIKGQGTRGEFVYFRTDEDGKGLFSACAFHITGFFYSCNMLLSNLFIVITC